MIKCVICSLVVWLALVGVAQSEVAVTPAGELTPSGAAKPELPVAESAFRLTPEQERAFRLQAEKPIYDLAKNFQYEAVIAAVGELEKKGPLSYAMEMQRLYSMSNLHKYAPALERADVLAAQYPDASDLALLRADLLTQLGRKDEALPLWKKVHDDNAKNLNVNIVKTPPVPTALEATAAVVAKIEATPVAVSAPVQKPSEPSITNAVDTVIASVTHEAQVVTAAVAAVESPIPAVEEEMGAIVNGSHVTLTEAESRTRRAFRVNREILLITVPILAFFIIARIALLWKISSNRKRIARESNSLES